jgi:hypothetical protein
MYFKENNIRNICISGYALYSSHLVQNFDWYSEWLAYHSNPENPPPPKWAVIRYTDINDIRESTVSVSINNSSVTVLKSNRVVGLPGFGLAFAFVDKCSRTQNHHYFHNP